jgi:hypothetical protein
MRESYVLRLVSTQSRLARLPYGKGTVVPTILVSCRTGDEPFAAVLIDEKTAERFGPDGVFRDARGIQLGEEFAGKVWRRLADGQTLLTTRPDCDTDSGRGQSSQDGRCGW